MKRRALRVVTFLVLGAILNIAVAWGCALLVDTNALVPRPYYSDVDEPRWYFTVRESLGRTSVSSYRLIQINNIPAHPIHSIGWSRVSHSPDPTWKRPKFPVIDSEVRYECAAGFPFRTLMGWRDIRSYTADATAPNAIANMAVTLSSPLWAIQSRPSATPPRFDDPARDLLPLRPIPGGFILNTIIYASACFIAVYHWRRFVQARRRARGRCQWCGYDAKLLPTSTCPECGRQMRGTTTIRERWLLACMTAVPCFAFGIAVTLAVALTIAWFGEVRKGPAKVAWPQPLPSNWLLQRIDSAGATEIRWVFDDKWARHVESSSKSIERARRRGDAEQIAREERRFADERSALLAERANLAPVEPALVPRWSSRIEILQGTADFESSAEAAFGWPFRAFAYGQLIGMSIREACTPGFVPSHDGWLDALPVHSNRRTVVLPLRPIWTGLIVDSVLFAIPLLAISWLWNRASRRRSN